MAAIGLSMMRLHSAFGAIISLHKVVLDVVDCSQRNAQ